MTTTGSGTNVAWIAIMIEIAGKCRF